MRSTIRFAAVSACLALSGQALGAQTIGIAALPSGFGLHGNTFATSLSGTYGQPRDGGASTRLDASASLSFGIGDPVNALGLQADVNLTSFRDFGASGYVSLTAHRMFQTSTAGVYSVALSVTNLAPWGDSAQLPAGYSLVGSYLFGLDGRAAMATLGVANNLNDARRVEGIVGFGMAVNDTLALSVGWAGNQSVLGSTWRPAALGGATVSVSLRGLEDRSRRTLGIDISRSFN